VTQLVDRLDADGLVTREPDLTDGCSRLAVITDAGRQAHERGTLRTARRNIISSAR
jgi:DNA-binding MarR family transcriptional regulator